MKDIEAVRREGKAGVDEADNGGDQVAGHRLVVVQAAERAHEVRRDARLLRGLAQRRVDGTAVLGLDTAAGKADLPGVVAQVSGALREQDAEARVAFHQRYQHRGRRERGLGAGQPVEVVVAEGWASCGRPGLGCRQLAQAARQAVLHWLARNDMARV